MVRTIGLKLAHLVPVLFLVSLATFFMLELIPGDPAFTIAGPDATPEQYQAIRDELGLDRPLLERYTDWLGDTLTGDFGRAFLPPERPVSEMIASRLPVTMQITLMGLGIALVIAIPMALLAAARPGSPLDRVSTAGAFGAISVPSFLAGLLLIFFFVFRQDIVRWLVLLVGLALLVSLAVPAVRRARTYPPGAHQRRYVLRTVALLAVGLAVLVVLFVTFPRFPRQGFERITGDGGIRENLRSAFLPALTLGLVEAAVWMRLLRSDLIGTLQEDFILSARAKGMPKWRILVRDALRPSSFSLITVAGVSLGRAIGGSIIVEHIFNLPGMGTMMIQAINGNDFRVVQTGVLLIAVFYVAVNAVVDLSYSYLDPRIRRGRP
ncbi:MAG: ABC transporter permease [Acidimicrobiales bacterium]